MKLTDMSSKSVKDLEKHANKLRSKINAKRVAIATSDDRHHREIRVLRKELAQTLTVANQSKSDTKEKSE